MFDSGSKRHDRLYYEIVRRAPTFRNHFFNWLPVWVIGSTFACASGRPGTPYWRPDVWLIVWGIWTGLYLIVLLSEWSKAVFITVYSDMLELGLAFTKLRFTREKIIRFEVHQLVFNNPHKYGWVKPNRCYIVHRNFPTGVRFFLRYGEETAAFVESRHPEELAAALEKMLHPDPE